VSGGFAERGVGGADPATASAEGPVSSAEDGRERAAPGEPDGREDAPDPVRELEARLAETEDRLLRARAELDNQRKSVVRALERERLEMRRQILRDWLEVADSADRALAAFADRSDDPVLAGLAALAAQIQEVLRRQGAVRFGAPGERFDPERHEAVGTMPANGVPDGHVAAVARPGYALDGQLLRPAQVFVALGAADRA
jgi:molecular chaperone GrpE